MTSAKAHAHACPPALTHLHLCANAHVHACERQVSLFVRSARGGDGRQVLTRPFPLAGATATAEATAVAEAKAVMLMAVVLAVAKIEHHLAERSPGHKRAHAAIAFHACLFTITPHSAASADDPPPTSSEAQQRELQQKKMLQFAATKLACDIVPLSEVVCQELCRHRNIVAHLNHILLLARLVCRSHASPRPTLCQFF